MQPTDPSNKPVSLCRPQKVPTLMGPPSPEAFGALVPVNGADPAAGPPALSAPPTTGALLQALRRRWALALIVATVGALTAVIVVLQLVPARYTAEARLQVSSRAPANVLDPNETQPDPALFRGNQEAIVKSAPVLNAALNKETVKDLRVVKEQINPSTWLEQSVKTDFKLGPEILKINISSDDAKEAQALVNAVADAYIEHIEKKEQQTRLALLERMRAIYTETQLTLFSQKRTLGQILKDRGADTPEAAKSKYESALRVLEEARKEAQATHRKKLGLQGELKRLRTEEADLPNHEIPQTVMDRYLKDDPTYLQYMTDLARVKKDIQSAREKLTPSAAQRLLPGYDEQRDVVLKDMAAYRKQQEPGVREQVRLDLQSTMSKMERELAGLQDQSKVLDSEVQRQEAEVQNLLPGGRPAMPEAEALRERITLTETGLNRLGDKIKLLELSPALGARVTLLQRAEVPQERDLSKQLKMAGVSGLGVFGLLLFGVALWEARSRKITSVEEVVRGLGINLIGTLPALPPHVRQPGPGKDAPQDQHWRNLMTESVDAIRTLMMHAAQGGDLQVVMITSARCGEGKTSLATHLAASLARAWRKTLLIDGDLRNPAAHRSFALPQEPGLSEVLRGEVSLADAIRPTSLSRLWMLPAGHWDSHAVQALAQEGVRNMFAQLKEQYDFVIVDSCPVLPVADALLLGQNVDAVIFSILSDVSQAPAVYAAQQRLNGLGICTLGAVVIGASGDPGGTYSYPSQTAVG